MSKAPPTKTQTSPGDCPSPQQDKRWDPAIRLIEIKPGLFLNADQIVSVRALPAEVDNVYAILQLSNGDTLNLTCGEFALVTGEERRSPSARPATAAAQSKDSDPQAECGPPE